MTHLNYVIICNYTCAHCMSSQSKEDFDVEVVHIAEDSTTDTTDNINHDTLNLTFYLIGQQHIEGKVKCWCRLPRLLS